MNEDKTDSLDAISEDVPSGPWGSEEDVIAQIKEHAQKGEAGLSEWVEEAKECYRFRAGQQWDEDSRNYLTSINRDPICFNFCAQYVAAIQGQEQANRFEVTYLPRTLTDGDPLESEMMTEAAKWVRDQCDAETEESDAFTDMLTCGLGWTCTELNYDTNPQGQIEIIRRSPFNMRYDMSATKRSLADARWFQCDYWMDEEEITGRWPDKEDELTTSFDLAKTQTNRTPVAKDGKTKKERRYQGSNVTAINEQHDGKKQVIHEVWSAREAFFHYIDPISREMKKVPEDQWNKINDLLGVVGKSAPEHARTLELRWYQAWYCADVLLDVSEAPTQLGSIYTAITGVRDEDRNLWYGALKPLLDPQRYVNTMVAQWLQIVRSGAKGGIMHETGAIKNIAKFENDWAKASSNIEVNPGGLAKIMPKPSPEVPAGAAEILRFAMDAMKGVTGVNIELLGAAQKDQPGMVEQMRTEASLVILTPWFDALRIYRKRQGRILADFINQYIPDGTMIRIIGSGMQQAIPLRKMQDAVMYDLVVDEAATSRDVKARTFSALTQIVPLVQAAGGPIPPDVLDYAPIPANLSMKWKQMLTQAMNQPKQTPLPVQIEQMRAQGEVELEKAKGQREAILEQQKQQFETFRQHLEVQTQQQIEQAQAASQQQIEMMKLYASKVEKTMDIMVEFAKTQMHAEADMQAAKMKQEMAMANQVLVVPKTLNG